MGEVVDIFSGQPVERTAYELQVDAAVVREIVGSSPDFPKQNRADAATAQQLAKLFSIVLTK